MTETTKDDLKFAAYFLACAIAGVLAGVALVKGVNFAFPPAGIASGYRIACPSTTGRPTAKTCAALCRVEPIGGTP